MQTAMTAWYVVRTKSKHEHIAAANLRSGLGLEVFLPRFRLERLTRRGLVKALEPLFPGYVFIRCVIVERKNEIQHTAGVGRVVQFGEWIPHISDMIIQELQIWFGAAETVAVRPEPVPGDEVAVTSGAFAGMNALVLKSLPAKRRVQILLDILGRPTSIEIGQENIVLKNKTVADWVPFMAQPVHREAMRA